ncbi:MAG: PAS domain S-box protein [Syntrophorhabdaceae bacterium]|nr:PAS domain S-box protein [Syntrophorhabdaceae bacterium]
MKNSPDEIHQSSDAADPMESGGGVTGAQAGGRRAAEDEERLRLIADSLPTAIVYIDRDFRYRFVNKTYESWYGRTGDNICGKRVEEVMGPPEWSTVRGYIERALEGETVVFEQEISDRAGAPRHVRSKIMPYAGPGSQIEGVYALISDTTEEKHIEAALRRSDHRYQTLFENIPVGICINTPDGRIISYNSVLQRMTGYTRAEISTMRTRDFYANSHDRQMLLKHLKNKAALRNYLVDLRRKNRKIFRALVSIVPHSTAGENTILTVVQDVTEYKKTEEALIESERRLTDIINFLPDATFAIDKEGRVIAWNRAMEEFSGVRAIDILGKGNQEYSLPFYGKRQPVLADFVLKPDRDAEKHYSFMTKEMDRLVAEPLEPLMLRGRPLYIWAKASPIYDLDGNITGVIQSVRDVTAQREAEQRLRESEERYRTAIECSSDGIAIVRGNVHLFVNRRFCDIFGFDSPDEVIGQTHVRTIDPEDLERVQNINERRQRGEEAPDKYEFKGRRKDGSVIYIEVSATGTTYRNEPVTLAYLRDVTERKLASDTLRDSEMRFHAIFDNANDAIFLLDQDTFVDCNRKALSMFACNKEEIVGQPPYLLSPPTQPDGSDSKEKALRTIEAAFRGTPQFFRWRHRRFDGTDFDTEISLNALELAGKIYLQAIVREKEEGDTFY